MIDPRIWEDPGFNSLSIPARLLFIGMFSNADDEGYLRADAGSLRRLVFGFDDIATGDVSLWIEELRSLRSLNIYIVGGEQYAQFLKWGEYQKQKAERIVPTTYPKCPEVSDKCRADVGQCQTSAGQMSDNVRQVPDNVGHLSAQDRLGKDRVSKDNTPPVVPQSGDSGENPKAEPAHISEILSARLPRSIAPPSSESKMPHELRADDMAVRLKITVPPEKLSGWYEIFRRAEKFGQNSAIDAAYSYVADWQPKDGEKTPISIVMMFFWRYNLSLKEARDKKATQGGYSSIKTICAAIVLATICVQLLTLSAKTQTQPQSVKEKYKDWERSEWRPVEVTPTPTLAPKKTPVTDLICSYFGDECATAVAVFTAESQLSCNAVGDGHLTYVHGERVYGASYGIAQIRYLPGRPDPSLLVDCEYNIRYAHSMWQREGWRPWSAYTTGAYRRYL